MDRNGLVAEKYFSKDFCWDRLKEEVESDPLLQYHFFPYDSSKEIADEDPGAQQDREAWNKFHTRHSTGKFFKERRYLLKEFPELQSCEESSTVLEVGCGNGSTALAILGGKSGIILYACDCSNEAIERTKEMVSAANSISSRHRFRPFLCDFSTYSFPSWLACTTCSGSSLEKRHLGSSGTNFSKINNDLETSSSHENKCCIGGVDFVTLIFTLSALPLDRMPQAMKHCFSVLKPGGLLLFRDYGLYDMTMLRFTPDQRMGYREYMRSDGTRSYYFCLSSVRNLISAAGFTEIELEYCCVKSTNRRNRKTMRRVWVHGKFQKPNQPIAFPNPEQNPSQIYAGALMLFIPLVAPLNFTADKPNERSY